MSDSYLASDLRCDADEVAPDAPPISDQRVDVVSYNANCFKQYFLITRRSLRNIIRIPLASYVKIMSSVIIACMMILIFQRLGTDTPSIQNRTGVLFFFVLNCTFTSIQGVILLLPDERGVFLRE
jgi:hypothetical protein